MRGEVAQHGAALLGILLLVALAEHGLPAGLVQPRIEGELAAVSGIGARRHQGPAGQHVGETDDVVLGVAGAHAERMQLHDLARKVLVEAAAAVDARRRVRAHRFQIVEIEQHGRMAFGGQQQIDEAAERIGAHRFSLIGAGHALIRLAEMQK